MAAETVTPIRSSQSPFDRAIDRATAAGLTVVGVGRFKRTGTRFWLVPSQRDPLRNHVVRLVGHALICDCTAAAHGRVCAHRAAVHMDLVLQAERRRAAAEVQEQLLRAEAAEAALDDDDREPLRYEAGWVPHMAPGPDPDNAEADRERWREMNMGGACIDAWRGWC